MYKVVGVIIWLVLFCVFCFKHYTFKREIYDVRCQMQQDGLIPKNVDLKKLFYSSLCFWFIPVSGFEDLSNEEHNSLVEKSNRLTYILIGLFLIVFCVVEI